ncbi:MAG: GAF domain-containing protein [Puniceicoccaceae bacterium]|nr:MAG: GAF domain-containing protein [Puniceicoccaceae bacterium]
MILLLTGLLLGALFGFLAHRRMRERLIQLDEDKQRILQEKQLVVDFMHEMVEALGEGLSRQELFQRIVHAAIVSTGALSAAVFEKTSAQNLHGIAVEGLFPPHRPLPEGSKVKLTTRAKFIEQILKSEEFPVGEGVIGNVARTGKAEWVPDAERDPRIIQHGDPALTVRSLIAAPILFRERLIGVLAVCNPADGNAFSETDFSLVQSLAEQAGMAIHNSEFLNLQIERRQIDIDLSLARSIQLMLVPQKFPVIPGLDIDARYLSAQKVGGDLFDFFPLSPTRLGLVVADVSGKGISASILMSICRTHLRHFARQGRSPAEVLIDVNRAMINDMRQDMFITMIYAVVDVETDTVEFARAGHELPLCCRLEGDRGVYTCDFLPSEGMPVGLVDAELFEEAIESSTISIAPGDVFVLYTDGVTEAANSEDKEFSGSRLADVVRTLRNRPSRELNAGILASIERFSGSDQYRDDLTLVTIRRVPADTPAQPTAARAAG